MGGARYVLDASVLIQASNQYYAFDLAPGFWTSLLAYAETGEICSIDRVRRELDRMKDGLSMWADTEFENAFASTDQANIVKAYGSVMNWAHRRTEYSRNAKDEFAEVADSWLVAYAKAEGCTVVTQESRISPRGKIKIPIACDALGVPCVDSFRMLRNLKVYFLDASNLPPELISLETAKVLRQLQSYGGRFLKNS